MAPLTCLKAEVKSGKFERSVVEPFCRVTMGKQSHETPPVSGNQPKWKAIFVFSHGKETTMRFEVFDKDVVIGYVDIDLKTLASRPGQNFRGNLELKPSGQIRVSLQLLRGKPDEGIPEILPPRHYDSKGGGTSQPPTPPRSPSPTTGRNDALLLIAPTLSPGAAAIASLWGDLASSQTVKHTPDPEFMKLIKDEPPTTPASPPVKRLSKASRDDRRSHHHHSNSLEISPDTPPARRPSTLEPANLEGTTGGPMRRKSYNHAPSPDFTTAANSGAHGGRSKSNRPPVAPPLESAAAAPHGGPSEGSVGGGTSGGYYPGATSAVTSGVQGEDARLLAKLLKKEKKRKAAKKKEKKEKARRRKGKRSCSDSSRQTSDSSSSCSSSSSS